MDHTGLSGQLQFSPERQAAFEALLPKYPTKMAALLPTLWLAQEEFGTITAPVMRLVARLLDLPPSHVLAVTTFYTMYNIRPVGRYHIQLCHTLSCELAGAERIVDHLCSKLHIQPGETTADGRFTLSRVECLGACGMAPMFQLNADYHEHLTPEKVDEILGALP